MPHLPQHAPAVDTITLPNTGVNITVRRNVTGRDRSEALAVALKLRQLGFDSAHVYMRYLCAIAGNLIISWDATNEDGELLPISPQQLGAIKDQVDYDFLMNDIASRVTLREDDPEKEGPFAPPSTPSSEDTSSQTQETPPTS